MDADEDPPDADGWTIHPASAFYGLWPRFTVEGEDAEPVSARSAAGVEH